MNERFEQKYFRDDQITIKSNTDGKLIGFSRKSDGLFCIHGANFDDDGLRALRDAINCKLDTGSFAALADTSDTGFTGKRVRFQTANDKSPVTGEIKWINGRLLHVLPDGENLTRCISPDTLLLLIAPEPPKPKVRPYKNGFEAMAAMMRLPCNARGSKGKGAYGILSVTLGVDFVRIGRDDYAYPYAEEYFTWSDDTPFGIPESDGVE